jgi:hypothetical protein
MKTLLLLAVLLVGCEQTPCSVQVPGAVEVHFVGYHHLCMVKQQDGRCLYFHKFSTEVSPFVADCVKPEVPGN